MMMRNSEAELVPEVKDEREIAFVLTYAISGVSGARGRRVMYRRKNGLPCMPYGYLPNAD